MNGYKFDFKVGALQPTFLRQAKKLLFDLVYDKEKLRHLQKQREAVHMLEFNEIIDTKTATKCHQKIVKKLIAHVVKKNNMKRVKS